MQRTIVTELSVSCQGEDDVLGHPLVYLQIGESGKVDCPYCGKIFIYDSSENRK